MALFSRSKNPYEEALENISPLATEHKKKKLTKSNVQLLIMVSLGILFIAFFAYVPMFGIVLAFKNADYSLDILQSIFTSEWVGFDNFVKFMQDPDFGDVMLNTLGLNLIQLAINFPAPIIFALLLSELPWKKIKTTVQTITYFPYFLSWITYGGILLTLTNAGGILNTIFVNMGIVDAGANLADYPEYFWPIIVISSLLKGIGWGSIIYVAAISGIDPQLYEAADMDGASRWHRIIHITIPSIAPTIVLFFILSISGILNNGFDHIWTFQNVNNLARSEVLDTFIYKYGTVSNMYSYTTAIGFFKSLVAIILLTGGNFVAKKLTGSGII